MESSKNLKNILNRAIDFKDAELVFAGPTVHFEDGFISMQRANKRERKQYEQKIQYPNSSG